MSNNTVMPDYTVLIDAQTQAFIEHTENALPKEATRLEIWQQRALYDAMCRELYAGYPAGVTSSGVSCGADSSADNRRDNKTQIPFRQYKPPSESDLRNTANIIYLHGGGFVVGSLESHDDVCAEICGRTGNSVISVDYRLSPEHKHPAALDDVMVVIEHIYQTQQQSIIVCGDSAGANLAAAACHAYRNKRDIHQAVPEIIGQLLIYPGLGGDTTQGSYLTHANAPMLSTDDVQFYASIRCRNATQMFDPLFAPLLDTSFNNLPPTIVFSAECDPLCDDGDSYCSNIRLAGGRAHWFKESGLVHGYLRARHTVERAKRSFDRIIEAITYLDKKQWPY